MPFANEKTVLEICQSRLFFAIIFKDFIVEIITNLW